MLPLQDNVCVYAERNKMCRRDRAMCFFFFKQKTAYEIGVRLVGSEMCIRDRDIQSYEQLN